eukprot:CAMPEP_0197050496 /NCGR_PEP_ID=MMETSP1384-20130603/25369_1 /TAXON_ID=29189 /ORGANISM="Ammonia sp." /LENGTH=313 /DNA_ID=CAMNT_0042482907 /DNA_START=38 /DNA_END=979 /DNA_ORIENTATION=+
MSDIDLEEKPAETVAENEADIAGVPALEMASSVGSLASIASVKEIFAITEYTAEIWEGSTNKYIYQWFLEGRNEDNMSVEAWMTRNIPSVTLSADTYQKLKQNGFATIKSLQQVTEEEMKEYLQEMQIKLSDRSPLKRALEMLAKNNKASLIDLLTGIFNVVLQITVYITLFVSVFKRYESDGEKAFIPYRRFLLVTLFVTSFLWSDIYKAILLFNRKNKGSKRTSTLILLEALIALIVGVSTTIMSLEDDQYTTYHLVTNVVGILFVHEIDEQIYEMYHQLKTNKEKVIFMVLFIVAVLITTLSMFGIRLLL